MRQLASNPWDSLHDKYPVGATVEGRVRNLTDFGAFIEIEDGIDGLVHVSNLSWTKRVKHPSEVLKKGDRVKAVMLAIEPDKRRLSLGVKQLQPDVWESFLRAAPRGRCAARQSSARGEFWRIRRDRGRRRGPLPQLRSGGRQRPAVDVSNPELEHDFKIIKMNPEEKKVGPQHQGRGRRGFAHRSGGLQASGFEHWRFDYRRLDVLEAAGGRIAPRRSAHPVTLSICPIFAALGLGARVISLRQKPSTAPSRRFHPPAKIPGCPTILLILLAGRLCRRPAARLPRTEGESEHA